MKYSAILLICTVNLGYSQSPMTHHAIGNSYITISDSVLSSSDNWIIASTGTEPEALVTSTYQLESIPDYEYTLSNIVILRILSDGTSYRSLPYWLGACSRIKQILLVDNDLTDLDLNKFPDLVSISLQRCKIGSIEMFTESLLSLRSLKRIYIDEEQYSSYEIAKLAKDLQSNSSPVHNE